jgi:hypothetical protein
LIQIILICNHNREFHQILNFYNKLTNVLSQNNFTFDLLVEIKKFYGNFGICSDGSLIITKTIKNFSKLLFLKKLYRSCNKLMPKLFQDFLRFYLSVEIRNFYGRFGIFAGGGGIRGRSPLNMAKGVLGIWGPVGPGHSRSRSRSSVT